MGGQMGKGKLVHVDEVLPKYKVILVGDRNTGKTSLFHRFLLNQYAPEKLQRDFSVNIGIKFFEFEGFKSIAVELWDIPSETHASAIVYNKYFRDAKGIIFAYSLDENGSVGTLRKYYETLTELYPSNSKQYSAKLALPAIVVGNKKDLLTKQTGFLNTHEIMKKQGVSWSNEVCLQHHLISSKQNKGVSEVMKSFLNLVLDQSVESSVSKINNKKD